MGWDFVWAESGKFSQFFDPNITVHTNIKIIAAIWAWNKSLFWLLLRSYLQYFKLSPNNYLMHPLNRSKDSAVYVLFLGLEIIPLCIAIKPVFCNFLGFQYHPFAHQICKARKFRIRWSIRLSEFKHKTISNKLIVYLGNYNVLNLKQLMKGTFFTLDFVFRIILHFWTRHIFSIMRNFPPWV